MQFNQALYLKVLDRLEERLKLKRNSPYRNQQNVTVELTKIGDSGRSPSTLTMACISWDASVALVSHTCKVRLLFPSVA